MKKSIIIAIGLVMTASSGYAELFEGEFLAKGQNSVRAEAAFMPDAGPDDTALGVEIGFGAALYALDDVAVFYTGQQNDFVEMQRVGLSIQEHYPLQFTNDMLAPFLGVAGGWAWLDDTEDLFGLEDNPDNSFFGRLELGALFRAHERMALAASARWNLALDDVFVDDNGLQDSAWDYAIGIRYYW